MLRIGNEFADGMIAHSQEEDLNECCGILSGEGDTIHKLYRITNTKRSPFRYLMDPQEMLNAMLESRRNGQELLAFYHSHTNSRGYPSSTDVRMAQQSGWLGNDIYYVLVSLEDKAKPYIKAYRIQESGTIIQEEIERA